MSGSDITRAVEILRAGGLVAFPTETVYGLGADGERADAVAKIFAAKGRPADHPLIVHVARRGALEAWAEAPTADAQTLARAFWPGPLTLVVRRPPRIPLATTGGLETVGLRVPGHPVALALLEAFDGAIAAPSANRFGRTSPTTAGHVHRDLGDDVQLVLDGGPCGVGIESTIVDLTGDAPAILRPGGVTPEMLAAALGRPVPVRASGGPRTPGQLPSHYAPLAAVELVAAFELSARAAALVAAGRKVGVLSLTADVPVTSAAQEHRAVGAGGLEAAARSLYAALRAFDDDAFDVILAIPPPETGMGLALLDRLRRAAAPR